MIICNYGEEECDVSSIELIPTWVKRTTIRKVIGMTGGTLKEQINYKPKYPRKCEVCNNTLKNKNTYFTHVVSKHNVTGAVL